MISSPYQHQQKIISEDPKKCGLFLGTGTGKTYLGLILARGKTLVICPKQQKEDETWERNDEKFGTFVDLTVVSKEQMRKVWNELPYFDTVIIDECHTVLGVTAETRQRNKKQIPKASQLFESVLNFITKNPPKRLYLCSATPISKPMNLWAIAKLLGVNWDYFKFRDKYYVEIRIGQRRVWIPKKEEGLKQRMAELVKEFGYTGGLNDFFDVPEQTHKVVDIELTDDQKEALKELMLEEADPLTRRGRARSIENGVLYGKEVVTKGKVDTVVDKTTVFSSRKIDYIKERALEFPKLLIFAYYTAQIYEISKALRDEGYEVTELTGKTKDRTFIKKVDESDKPHIIVAQSGISAGYELPSFPCVIYASKSWQFVHYEQSLGRVLRSNKLKKNLYIHLVVDGVDSDCHKAIIEGSDFQEKLSLDSDSDIDL